MKKYTSAEDFYLNEKTLPTFKTSKPYSRVFTSFSGADVVLFVDGETFGEAQAITWKQNLDAYSPQEIQGVITATKFDQELTFSKLTKPVDIRVLFISEYGDTKMYLIEGVRVTGMQGGISIDDVCEETSYTYKADAFTEIDNYIYELEGKLSYIRANKNKQDNVTMKTIKVYKEEVISNMLDYRYIPMFHSDFIKYQELKDAVDEAEATE